MTLLIVYLLVAVGFSFLCSILEAVLLSSTTSFVALAAQQGKKFGILLQSQKNQIDRPLAAILTLNTISHTVGAAGVGAQVLKIYGDEFVAISSAIMTVLILVVSEIVPKTLGALHWKKLAPMSAYTIRILIYATYPFVVFSELIYKLLSGGRKTPFSREELIVTAELGTEDGTIRPKESAIIKNLLMLDNVKVSEIMTPRSVIGSFECQSTVGEVMKKYRPIRFSRLPVYDKTLDQIRGMVHRYKILEAYSNDQDDKKISDFMTPLQSIPETISVAAALDQFIRFREHLFLVVDEYGTTSGLVSLEDAIETLLGVEIVDEFDSVDDMRQYALDLWKERKKKGGSQKFSNPPRKKETEDQ